MFTGIITDVGRIAEIEPKDAGLRLTVGSHWDAPGFALGESIAIDGACMTVVAFDGPRFSVELSSESLDRTTLGLRRVDDRVNLERALCLGDRMGGHWVTGHVDARGTLVARETIGDCERLTVGIPREGLPYFIEKGSVAIDGVSLTVNGVRDASSSIEVLIVPHSLSHTSLSDRTIGDALNLEYDFLGKYVQRMLELREA